MSAYERAMNHLIALQQLQARLDREMWEHITKLREQMAQLEQGRPIASSVGGRSSETEPGDQAL